MLLCVVTMFKDKETVDDVLPKSLTQAREVKCEEYTLCIGHSRSGRRPASSYEYMDPVFAITESCTPVVIGLYLGYSKDSAYKKRMMVMSVDGTIALASFGGYKDGKVKRKLTSSSPGSIKLPETPSSESVEAAIQAFIRTLRPAPKGMVVLTA